jgi:hypothetical protein
MQISKIVLSESQRQSNIIIVAINAFTIGRAVPSGGENNLRTSIYSPGEFSFKREFIDVIRSEIIRVVNG